MYFRPAWLAATVIVVGADGSETSWNALWWACGKAGRRRGRRYRSGKPRSYRVRPGQDVQAGPLPILSPGELMSRIFITGSADGLGLMAAALLLEDGHQVTLHARNDDRGSEVRARLPAADAVVIGDLSVIEDVRGIAEQVNALGHHDAVIHNAAVGSREPRRIQTADGLSHVFAINVLAPYLLTALITGPQRLVYLSSGLHTGGEAALDDPQWEKRRWNGLQAYSDSKLDDVLLAFAVARRWPEVHANAVTPGWVATKMGGPGAADDLSLGPVTQAWLAAGEDPRTEVTGQYFYHQQSRRAHPAAHDPQLQDALLDYCAALTTTPWPGR
jgi:NAD(P)-dependent dehydrogenase (short-subunit alcohol dehydrogenase family)